jgi:hypothetical protein
MNREKECVAGCKTFTGGEVKHHKDCPYYQESLSMSYDKGKLDGASEMQEAVLKVIDEVTLLVQEGRDNPFNNLQDDAFNCLIEAENKLKSIKNIKPQKK